MFKPINAKRINFSEEQVKTIELGCDLSKRYLYNFAPNVYHKYASFANIEGIDYRLHNKEFSDRVAKAAYERSGKDPEKVDFSTAFRMQDYVTAYFSVIEEVIDNVNSKNEIEEILTFADVRNMAEGDSMSVNVKPTNAYFFYKTGRGKAYGRAQKYYGKNITLTPSPAETTIAFNRKDIIAGRVDWGKEIARAVRGIRSGYLQDIASIIYDTSSNPIGNKIISTGAYSEIDFRTNLQTLQARNGSSNTVIYGTSVALSPLLPANTNLQLGLGIDYMDKGYLATPFGYRSIELPQALKADNTTAILSNNYVIAMSLDTSKPISIGISGETRINTLDPQQNMGEDFVYTVKTDWD